MHSVRNRNLCVSYNNNDVMTEGIKMRNYVAASLETHLFFGRIMKEHSLFLLAAFPAGENNYRKEADWYREQFEKALEQAVQLANGNVGEEVLRSKEVVTAYTESAERQTRKLTGIPIDIQITQAEKRLQAGGMKRPGRETMQRVRRLNQRIMRLVAGLIGFKERILRDVLSCNLYTANYPLLIEHIIREARWYLQALRDIENGRMPRDDRNVEIFWNQIMMEHAEFIRGLLDPTEEELMEMADDFAEDFRELLDLAKQQDFRVSNELTRRTLEKTQEYRDFKAKGTQGITDCNIRSVILPLLADHVLREANHYLRLLEQMDMYAD